MSELIVPEGWKLKTIEDICETITSGGTPSRSDSSYFNGDIPWVKMTDLKNDLILYTKERLTKKGIKNSSAKIFPKNTVLIAMYTFDMGKTAILGVDAATNQAICGLQCKNDVLPKFLLYFIKSHQNQIKKLGSGGAQPNINQSKVKSLCIPMPPLETQKKIVQKLDHIFGQLEEKKREILELQSNKLKNSKYLSDNFMNYIISKFIPIENHPVSWKSVTLADIFLIINQKWQPNSISTSLNYIGLENIESNTGKLVNFLPINSLKIKSLKTHFLKKHVLYGKLRPYLNKILLPTFDGVCSTDILVLEPKSIVLREFLAYFLRSSHVLSKMTQLMYGTKMPRAKIQDLEKIRLGLPSKEEQEKIIRKIQRSENHIHTIRESITTSIEQQEKTSEYLKYLRSSILDKAFSGKLVN